MTELIIDICYNCNSICKYCQWNKFNYRNHKETILLSQLLLSPKIIESLSISRILLSGGEPSLANNLKEILKYYSKFNLPI
ncbi:hypothetical protein LCGC14_2248820 [marine sediment metagenome]|uniref:Radical SAM core domain-containing protein n=1 Tax=marine sediment metagenome TaxID=412755 RepID=A0A0F9D2Y6_9ZZZZ